MINSTKMTKYCRDKPSVLYENRYCNQDEFDIILCGERNSDYSPTNEVIKLKGPEFQASVILAPMLTSR